MQTDFVSHIEWADPESCTADAYDSDFCTSCRDVILDTESMIISSVVTEIVQMVTDLQRSTPYGDVNCQKVMGMVTGNEREAWLGLGKPNRPIAPLNFDEALLTLICFQPFLELSPASDPSMAFEVLVCSTCLKNSFPRNSPV